MRVAVQAVGMDRYRTEIEDLHEFFVEWYDGALPESAFERLDNALAPEFTMVTPAGEYEDREAVLDWIRGAHGRDADRQFDIEIRAVDVVATGPEHTVVRYEEHQTVEGETDGRISTVTFREDDLAWLALHETAIEG